MKPLLPRETPQVMMTIMTMTLMMTTKREQKRQEYIDAGDRNCVEGVFGTTKTAYGLDPVAARLEETTKTVIGIAILVFNLKKLIKASLSLVLEWLLSIVGRLRVTIAA